MGRNDMGKKVEGKGGKGEENDGRKQTQRWETRKVEGIYDHERKKRQKVVALEEYVRTEL